MNIQGLEKSAKDYHKGAMAIASRLVGIPEQAIKTTPIIVKKGSQTFGLVLGKSNILNNMDYMQPFIMNGAFSLEIKMKLIYLLEKGEQLQVHNLLKLYEELSQNTKSHVREKVKEISNSSAWYKDISREINSKYKIQFSWEPHKLISNSALAFDRWRYVFEDIDKPTWFAGYIELQQAFDSRLNEIKSYKAHKPKNRAAEL